VVRNPLQMTVCSVRSRANTTLKLPAPLVTRLAEPSLAPNPEPVAAQVRYGTDVEGAATGSGTGLQLSFIVRRPSPLAGCRPRHRTDEGRDRVTSYMNMTHHFVGHGGMLLSSNAWHKRSIRASVS
jgi:hypothetical protein